MSVVRGKWSRAASALIIGVALTCGGLLASSTSVGADTGANGILTITPSAGLTPGGSLGTTSGATGTPTVGVNVSGLSGNWFVGTCPASSGSAWPPATVAGCDFEGWFQSGVTSDAGTGSMVLLPYVCGEGAVRGVGPNGPSAPVGGPGGAVALGVAQSLGNPSAPILDYVVLQYDCGGGGGGGGTGANVSVPGGTATVTPSVGTVENLTNTPVPAAPPPPAGRSFPYGLLGFSVTGLTTGQSVTVTVDLPAAVSEYWKLQNGAWTQLTGATFSGTSATFTLVDGGAGDADGAANGVIVDPGGPALVSAARPVAMGPRFTG